MGTPQFPDLGKHCSVQDCKQIDFLPFTCDRCRQVFCLEHRSYIKHSCPKADSQGVTVVICPLCAKGVRLNPDQDPNICWEIHVNTECDPSNYEKVTKKRKCPVPGCRDVLTFSNTIKCRECTEDHCLRHRFGPDHNCPGPKKLEASFQFLSLLNRNKKEDSKPNRVAATSSSRWTTSLLNAASTVRASAEAGMSKLGSEITQAWQSATNGASPSSSSSSVSGGIGPEECPQCGARFSSVTTLVEHVQKVHERSTSQSRVLTLPMDVCPKCSRGFRDAVALVEHVERDHAGTSKA
ncbi:stress-associated protein [Turnera subulata]|uniref:Stress-associated protein n=1 Tax=Turnera subulata TaxID=218843 RepID=A0A9Q0G316_9ROSI|nr:stress-associated protein [Turnera subulata]